MKFKARIRESGPVHILTVPKQYITDGHLRSGTLYEWEPTEVEEHAEQPEQG